MSLSTFMKRCCVSEVAGKEPCTTFNLRFKENMLKLQNVVMIKVATDS